MSSFNVFIIAFDALDVNRNKTKRATKIDQRLFSCFDPTGGLQPRAARLV
jgi:hypothetical protein